MERVKTMKVNKPKVKTYATPAPSPREERLAARRKRAKSAKLPSNTTKLDKGLAGVTRKYAHPVPLAYQVEDSRGDAWIKRVSGKPRLFWVAVVQGLIKAYSKPTKDPWHGSCDPDEVVKGIVFAIRRYAFPKKARFDGNMRMAAVLSYVFTLWYCRVHRAKAYDPRRPVRHRKDAYFTRLDYMHAMFDAMEDESLDSIHFTQKWESPFDPFPTDGYFV